MGIYMKIIIVDIDNTLWDFATEFEKRLKFINPSIPDKSYWTWDTPRRYIPENIFHETINDIHLCQNEFIPFSDAECLLRELSKQFKIIIASHRLGNTLSITEHWLQRYNLYYDELFFSTDKTVLFMKSYENVFGIIDDCPDTLLKARERGLIGTGLRYPWNKHITPMFYTLGQVMAYLNYKFEEVISYECNQNK